MGSPDGREPRDLDLVRRWLNPDFDLDFERRLDLERFLDFERRFDLDRFRDLDLDFDRFRDLDLDFDRFRDPERRFGDLFRDLVARRGLDRFLECARVRERDCNRAIYI